MDLEHSVGYRRGCAGVTETPACHGVSLGEAVYNDSSFLHAGKSCDGNVASAVGKLGVNFVGKDNSISLKNNVSQSLKLIFLKDNARGVRGIGKDNELGFVGNSGAELLGSKLEAVLFSGDNLYRYTVSHSDKGLIAYEAGEGNDDLVAGLNESSDGKVDCFTCANGGKDLRLGIVIKLCAALHVFGELEKQLLRAFV